MNGAAVGEILGALRAEIVKMFAADLALSLSALAAVGLFAVALRVRLVPLPALPFVFAAGILACLAVAVLRGGRK